MKEQSFSQIICLISMSIPLVSFAQLGGNPQVGMQEAIQTSIQELGKKLSICPEGMVSDDRILFKRDRNLFLIKPDGTGETQLTNITEEGDTVSCGSWSNSGSKIAYTFVDHYGCHLENGGGTSEVHIVNRDGSGDTPLPFAKGVADSCAYQPIFSPDDSEILFRHFNYVPSDFAPFTLYKGNFSTNALLAGNPQVYGDFSPAYKNREAEGCFIGTSFFYAEAAGPGSPLHIWGYHMDPFEPLSSLGLYIETGLLQGGDEVDPRCFIGTFGGGKILFTRYVCAEGEEGSCVNKGSSTMQLFLFDLDNLSLTRLAEDFYSAGLPSWSPDGSKIAFIGSAEGSPNFTRVYVMNADGKNIVPTTSLSVWPYSWQSYFGYTSGETYNSPDWSPDGQWVVFQNGSYIWVVKADGTGTASDGIIISGSCPDWSPLVCREASKPKLPRVKVGPTPSPVKKIKTKIPSIHDSVDNISPNNQVPSPAPFIEASLSCDRLYKNSCDILFCECMSKLRDEKYAEIFEDEDFREFYQESCVSAKAYCEYCWSNDECLVPH